jgi:hypothetical protein
LAKAEYDAIDLADASARVRSVANHAKQLVSSIADKIYGFVCDPTKSPPAALQVSELPSCDGSMLAFRKQVDWSSGYIFMDSHELAYICRELMSNWVKHKTNKTCGARVEFRIRKTDDVVLMEFWDDIEGKYDLSSSGGLGFVVETCAKYGARVFPTYDTGSQSKQLTIEFSSLTMTSTAK